MPKVVVIGAGVMGLAAAYQVLVDGLDVDILEASTEPGGMAAHFDFGGISIERFYHFVCKTDHPTFELLADLGIADKMRWVPTTMGFFSQGKLHHWGDPISLLKLPGVSLISKLRYGFFIFACTHHDRWPALENRSAREWITRYCGKDIYDRFWHPLLDFKYYEYADNISAAWIWTRIRRVGKSRKNIMQEELGYIDGGSKTLVDALMNAIDHRGGRLHLSTPVNRVVTENGRVTGVSATAKYFAADDVISTVPIPLIPGMVPDLPPELKARYQAIRSIGVICVIFRLKRSVSPHFWVNISEDGIQIPGIIEFSNLRSVGDNAIVYVPYYMPVTNAKFSWTEDRLCDDAFACLQRINPTLGQEDIVDVKVARLRHGQPVCEPGFAAKIPPIQTPIHGLQIADTCYYYPEDRGIAESVRMGRNMARSVKGFNR
ncbi:MAG TPA: NAD(P)/FAD-dependent oxidoreductase [Acidobacteriaceae bacterium]|nr:NAD(P)/FAD-dependent oxidoreductase [Acidobacteriaceae bacterium]